MAGMCDSTAATGAAVIGAVHNPLKLAYSRFIEEPESQKYDAQDGPHAKVKFFANGLDRGLFVFGSTTSAFRKFRFINYFTAVAPLRHDSHT
jgi:hypothetical protein